MCRTLFIFGVVGLIALATGCTMCAHPYDYCGPTFMGQCGESCAPDARAGSILSDTIEPISDIEMVDAGIVH